VKALIFYVRIEKKTEGENKSESGKVYERERERERERDHFPSVSFAGEGGEGALSLLLYIRHAPGPHKPFTAQ
jgi:hypothetical protein